MKRWLSYLHLLLSVSAMAYVPVHPAAVQNTLTVYAAHPSGQFTTNKASTFTVDASAADVVDTKFDGGGYVTNRVWKNSQGQVLRTQNLTWDAFGRLVKQTERDVSNNGYNWQTDFDPLGRRLRTVTLPVTNNVAINSQQRTLNHFYDPQVEFLEVGLSVNGTTTWKTYGPDLDGVYGGQQGLGGLESLTTGSTTVGVIQDGFGNVVGSAKNGSVTWNTARVGLYGPAEGYPGRSISVAPLTAEHLAYRGKWRDEAGFYYWGARPYDAERHAFLSFDTLGHDATPDGYTAFAGRPSDIWDADGRWGKQAIQWAGGQFADAWMSDGADQGKWTAAAIDSVVNTSIDVGNGMAGPMPWYIEDDLRSPMQRILPYSDATRDAAGLSLMFAGPYLPELAALSQGRRGAVASEGTQALYWHSSAERIEQVAATGVLGQSVGAGEKYWATTRTLSELGPGQWAVGGRLNVIPPRIKPPFEATYQLSPSESSLFKPAWGPQFSWNVAEWWKGAAGQYYFAPAPISLGQRAGELAWNLPWAIPTGYLGYELLEGSR